MIMQSTPASPRLVRKYLDAGSCPQSESVYLEFLPHQKSSWIVPLGIFLFFSLAFDLRALAFIIKHQYPRPIIFLLILGALITIGYTIYLFKLQANTLFYKLKFNSDGLEVYKGQQKVSSYKWEDVDSLIIDLSSTGAYALRFRDNKRVLLPTTWSPQLKTFLSCLLYHQPRLAGQIEEYLKVIYPRARIED